MDDFARDHLLIYIWKALNHFTVISKLSIVLITREIIETSSKKDFYALMCARLDAYTPICKYSPKIAQR